MKIIIISILLQVIVAQLIYVSILNAACINVNAYVCKQQIGDFNLFHGTPAQELAKAILKNDTLRMRVIISMNMSLVNCQEPKYMQSILQWAIRISRYEACVFLCRNGANVNLEARDGSTPLITAAEDFDTSVFVKVLLTYGADVNHIARRDSVYYDYPTPLMAAAGTNLESLKLLVEAGANIDYVSPNNKSPLYMASLGEAIEAVHYLLIEKHANPIVVSNDNIYRDSAFLTFHLRAMAFKIESREYRLKMAVVRYLKRYGIDYWKTPIPSHYRKLYSQKYLKRY